MPRSQNGTKREPVNKPNLRQAFKQLKNKKLCMRAAAKLFNLLRSTLKRNYEHYLKVGGDDPKLLHDNLAVNTVFTKEEEELLVDYIKEAARLHYGLTLKDVRRLAYEYAKQNNKKSS